MRVFLGFEGFDFYDPPEGGWMPPLVLVEKAEIPGEPDLTVMETPERDPARLWRFLCRYCGKEFGWQGCAVFAVGDDFAVRKRRAIDLYGPPPEALTPGELWLAGWFLRPERQLLNKRFQLDGHPFLALALDAGENAMTLWLASPWTGRKSHTKHAAKREREWEEMAQLSELEELPGICVAGGTEYGMGRVAHDPETRPGRFLAEFWKDQLPPEWGAVQFLELVWDGRNDTPDKAAPQLPVRSLALRKSGPDIRRYPVSRSFTARVGKQDEPIDYPDPQSGETLRFYAEGLQLIDVNAQARAAGVTSRGTGLPEGVCVLALAYETASPRYHQLDFHFREEMDQSLDEKWPPEGHPFLWSRKPRRLKQGFGPTAIGGSVGWIFLGKEKGPHGFTQKFCSLGPVDAGFCGEVKLEMTCVYEQREETPEIDLLEV